MALVVFTTLGYLEDMSRQ